MQQSQEDSQSDAALVESPFQFEFVEVAQPDVEPNGRIFVPSRANTPEPSSPRSRPVSLKSPSERCSPPLYEPYPTPSASPSRKRTRVPGNKRSMNAFLIYRREFPSRYPHIDALERHQGPKSAIIGAMWRAEPLEVKEYFFRLQAAADEEFRKTHGTTDAPRADPVKTLMRRERARQRRTRDEKLVPRSELIVKLWSEKKSVEEFIKAVQEYDEQCKATTKPEPKMKIVMASSPLSNHTNTPMEGDIPLPTPPVLHIQPIFMACTDAPVLSAQLSSPVDSPILRTPSPAPGPIPVVAVADPTAEWPVEAEHAVPLEPKPVPQAFDAAYFTALLELVPFEPAPSQVMPPLSDPDVLMAQLFSGSSFLAPSDPWNSFNSGFTDISHYETDLAGPSVSHDGFTAGWTAYTDGTFDFEHTKGTYAFGDETDLVSLESYGNLVEPVDNLVDCYIEMASLPP